jgi:GT2 family glycosyltransferase
VLVVDDGSTDGSADFLRKRFDGHIDVLRMEDNVGFIRANNAGIAFALERYRPDYVMLLNNDTQVIESDWLARLVGTAEAYGDQMGLICPRLVFSSGHVQWSGRGRERNAIALILQTVTARLNPGFAACDNVEHDVMQVNTVSGACMLIKSALIERIGALDVSLAPAFQEDVEYSFRTWRAGYKVLYQPAVKVVHDERRTFEENTSPEAVKNKKYLAVRNAMVVSLKYFGIYRTFLLGLPIFVVAALLDVKDKYKKLGLTNITLAQGLTGSLATLWKSSVDALRIYKSQPHSSEIPPPNTTAPSNQE